MGFSKVSGSPFLCNYKCRDLPANCSDPFHRCIVNYTTEYFKFFFVFLVHVHNNTELSYTV